MASGFADTECNNGIQYISYWFLHRADMILDRVRQTAANPVNILHSQTIPENKMTVLM